MEDSGKLTVVLDMDETLVHAQIVSDEELDAGLAPQDNDPDVFYVNVNGILVQVRKRPFLDEFLREAAKNFELIVFTAGCPDYAAPILDIIDPTRTLFRYRLFRQHCMFNTFMGNYVKDLRIVNRNLQRTVLVDNNVHSFLMQLGNGIPIQSFFDQKEDKELVYLSRLLHNLSFEVDVRFPLTKMFSLPALFTEIARSRFPNVSA